jgi:hypothetical protein
MARSMGHGFHVTAQEGWFTVSESAQREVLSQLLKLNHERYEAEQKAGLHEKEGKKKSTGNGWKAKGKPSPRMGRWGCNSPNGVYLC